MPTINIAIFDELGAQANIAIRTTGRRDASDEFDGFYLTENSMV